MIEPISRDWSLKEWSDLFSDPASSLSGFEKGIPFRPGFPTSLRLALWLELFLLIGEGGVKKQLAFLPEKELIALGIRLLQCYLSQPLYVRIFRGENRSIFKRPLNFKAEGKLYQVEQGGGEKKWTEILYPLDHRRLWPKGLRLLPEWVFAAEAVFKTLEPEMHLAASSGLEKIRVRVQTLETLFQEGRRVEIPAPLSAEEPPPPPINVVGEGGKREGTKEEKGIKTVEKDPQPAQEIQDLAPSLTVPSGKRKKRKSSQEQLELFQ
ncbi:MAG: hypothetical protein AB1585_21140 [Thermodesulfobacteriota bacterium]